MPEKIIETYLDYAKKIGDRRSLYKAVAEAFDIHSAIYPGSHVDIAPSLVIPNVTYIDSFKGAISFFKHLDVIKDYVEQNKTYPEPCEIRFFGQDYHQALTIDPVDLIISQYAGFVGQATKSLLKVGGILLCNDSHGDATLANFDEDYALVGVIDSRNKIRSSNLDAYFVLPGNKPADLDVVKQKMKGLKYTHSAENYLFRRIR